MRILSVEIEGFGPFKTAQSVDFTGFDDFGIFLIGGRTGAGKSTILDAICFALYGSVPRYDDYSGAARLRSDHCGPDDDTRVTLAFEADGREYRIVRSPDYPRPKRSGTGFTEQKARAELSVRAAAGWEAVETKVSEVGRRVREIVGLDKGQFLQVILLAQGRFQEFLEAQSDARQALLRTLFGTKRFDDYVEMLTARARGLAEELKLLGTGAERTTDELADVLGTDAPPASEDRLAWAGEGVTALKAALAQAAAAETEATAAAGSARTVLDAARTLAERQRRRTAALGHLAEFTSRAESIAVDRGRLETAEQASVLTPFLDAADAADAVLAEARGEEAEAMQELGRASDLAIAGLPELAPDGGLADGELAEQVETLGREIGLLAHAHETEAALPDLVRAATAAEGALTAHDEATAGIPGERVALRERTDALTAEHDAATLAAADADSAEAALGALTEAHTAAVDADRLDERLEGLLTAEAKALTARSTADARVAELVGHQRLGRAAILAGDLTEGGECPVCGSREHPHPAQWDGEPVTDQQVEDARDAFAAASRAADAASAEVAALKTRIAERRGAAGGRGAEQLASELDVVRSRLAAAQDARTRLVGIATARTAAETEQTKLDERERTATATRDALAKTATLTAAALTNAQSEVDTARGEHPTVAGYLAVLVSDRARLQRLIAARAAVSSAAKASDTASRALRDRLSARGFADRTAAEAAALPEAERERLAAAVKQHDDGLLESRAVLDQAELQELPEEPADLDGAAEAADAADIARRAAIEHRVALDATVTRAQELAGKLAGELRRTAGVEAQHRTVSRLAATVKGDVPNDKGIPLESFVLAAELEQIVAAANSRLSSMSQGRYAFEHSAERIRGGKRTGLELSVYDAHTGVTRSPRSLSGGEKFLHSLALALGLAEVVTSRAGGIRLDTLFIDEGFGSLDDDTLEVAMQTLDELRAGGRTVGLISHVEAMKEQIPAQLRVDVTEGGWSVIRQE